RHGSKSSGADDAGVAVRAKPRARTGFRRPARQRPPRALPGQGAFGAGQARARRPPRRPEAALDWFDEASANVMPPSTASSTFEKRIHSPPLASWFIRKFAARIASIST